MANIKTVELKYPDLFEELDDADSSVITGGGISESIPGTNPLSVGYIANPLLDYAQEEFIGFLDDTV